MNRFHHEYRWSYLQTWRPLEGEVNPEQILIKETSVAGLLQKLELPTADDGTYLFDYNSAARWWITLLKLIALLKHNVENQDFSEIVVVSEWLHSLLRNVPGQLWAVKSLNHHVMDAKTLVEARVDEYAEDGEDGQDEPPEAILPGKASNVLCWSCSFSLI